MSSDRDTTRIVRSWLDEGATALPDRVLDAVLDQLPATPQRPATWLARRTRITNSKVRLVAAAAAVVLVTVIGIQFIGPQNVVAPPTATPAPSVAAPSAAATTLPLPLVRGFELTAGTTYFLPDFPVGVAFTVADDRWHACSESPVEQLLCYYPSGDFAGQLGFLIVTDVAVDPCSPGEAFPDPPVGPSVEDLVTAISGLEGYEVTTPVDTSVDGFSGKLLTVSASYDSGCDSLAAWATEDRITRMLPGETHVLRIIDVEGARIVITSPDPQYPYASAFDAVLNTVQIEP